MTAYPFIQPDPGFDHLPSLERRAVATRHLDTFWRLKQEAIASGPVGPGIADLVAYSNVLATIQRGIDVWRAAMLAAASGAGRSPAWMGQGRPAFASRAGSAAQQALQRGNAPQHNPEPPSPMKAALSLALRGKNFQ